MAKRQYKTHVNISDTLNLLIEDSKPQDIKKAIALDQLNINYQVGKINVKVLKMLFKVVIDDIYYEIDNLYDYVKYLKQEVKRLKQIDNHKRKLDSASSEKKQNYYLEGINLLLNENETIENYFNILVDYEHAIIIREERIEKLYKEISIIKNLQKLN